MPQSELPKPESISATPPLLVAGKAEAEKMASTVDSMDVSFSPFQLLENLDPLTVVYLMRISYRASVTRQRAWLRLTKQDG
jgi:hypothetical protein